MLCLSTVDAVAQPSLYSSSYDDEQYLFRASVPHGFIICTGPPSHPLSYSLDIPLDGDTRCPDVGYTLQGADGAGGVVIEPSFEVADDYGSMDRLVYHACRPDPKRGSLKVSPMKELLGGKLPMVLCVYAYRDGRIAQIALARWQFSAPADSIDWTDTIDYQITAYSHAWNREQVNALFISVAKLIKLTRQRRRNTCNFLPPAGGREDRSRV